jgi:hypothetical protein
MHIFLAQDKQPVKAMVFLYLEYKDKYWYGCKMHEFEIDSCGHVRSQKIPMG